MTTDDATKTAVRSFWLLGLLNNSPWVLMLAVATHISAGGVALVFISNQVPGLVVKVTAPYWFHLIGYRTRMLMASFTMALACFLVGCGGLFRDEMSDDGDDAKNNEPKDAGRRSWGLALELLGVSFVSFSCNLGEASLLALAGKFDGIVLPSLSPDSYLVMSEEQMDDYAGNTSQHKDGDVFTEEYGLKDEQNCNATDSERSAAKLMKRGEKHQRACITAFSSGTGLAGIVGYGYKSLFSEVFGLGLSATVWSAMAFAVAYALIYLKGLHGMEQNSQNGASSQQSRAGSSIPSESSQLVKNDPEMSEENNNLERGRHEHDGEEFSSSLEMVHTEGTHPNAMGQFELSPQNSTVSSNSLTSAERFRLVLSLWPYTIPLFTVYAAEYMLQAGVWSAIGFPVDSAKARAQFYHYSNWTYQAGVFISRSSGNLCTASIRMLWLMPFLQVVNLYFFWMNSIRRFWYNYGLLLPCFVAGLLGGGVYVQGYARVNADMPAEQKEFAIAGVSVADSLGILVADIMSLFIQSCIYSANHVEGAVVDCPVNMM